MRRIVALLAFVALLAAACGSLPPGAGTSASSTSGGAASSTLTSSTTSTVRSAGSLACSATSTDASPVSVSDGPVTVTLTWTSPGEVGGPAVIDGGRIVLREQGTTLFDEALTPPSPANDLPMTSAEQSSWARGWEQASPCVEIPETGAPLVYLNGWAAAMTCCGVERVYYPEPGGSYASLDRDQGRSYPSEQTLDGHVVIMGYNRDWNSHYSCGACAGPVQIIAFQANTYVDLTRKFPSQIQADATKLLSYTTPAYDALIPLAAWVADECELGRQDQAFSTLDAMQSTGELTPPASTTANNFGYTLTGSAYLADLHAFLHQEGYCT